MTDDEIIRLAKKMYQDDDIRIETNPETTVMVDRAEDGTGAWVRAVVWVPLGPEEAAEAGPLFLKRDASLGCERAPNVTGGWRCISRPGFCPYYGLGDFCLFDEAAEQEWRSRL